MESNLDNARAVIDATDAKILDYLLAEVDDAELLECDWLLALLSFPAIAELIEERLSVMPTVARYKFFNNLVIEDIARETTIRGKIFKMALAEFPNLDTDQRKQVAINIALFFGRIMELAKERQREIIAGLMATSV